MSFTIPNGLVVFTGNDCPRCTTLKRVLSENNKQYTEINVHENADALLFLQSKGLRGIPVMFFDGERTTQLNS